LSTTWITPFDCSTSAIVTFALMRYVSGSPASIVPPTQKRYAASCVASDSRAARSSSTTRCDGRRHRSPWFGALLCAVPLAVGLLLASR